MIITKFLRNLDFIDEIVWIKPEPSVPNRVGGYMQTRKPLSYKPNCITESIMVYRKKCDFLLDKISMIMIIAIGVMKMKTLILQIVGILLQKQIKIILLYFQRNYVEKF